MIVVEGQGHEKSPSAVQRVKQNQRCLLGALLEGLKDGGWSCTSISFTSPVPDEMQDPGC